MIRRVGAIIALVFLIGAPLALILRDASQGGWHGPPPAEHANLRELYSWFQMYRNSHAQQWPASSGQQFVLALWRERSPAQRSAAVRRFFSAEQPFAAFLASQGRSSEIDPVHYLDHAMPGELWINYAGFDSDQDPALRAKLRTHPEQVTIVAHATFSSSAVICAMTADGAIHELVIAELLDQGLLTQQQIDSGVVPVGRDSPIPLLRTVSSR